MVKPMNARKQRILAIAALALTIILLVSITGSSTSNKNNASLISNTESKSTNSKLSNSNNIVKDKSGKIDESKVKKVEEMQNIKAPVQAPGRGETPVDPASVKKIVPDKNIVGSKNVVGSDAKLADTKLSTSKQSSGNVNSDLSGGSSSSSSSTDIKTNKGLEKEQSESDESSEFDPAKEFKEILSISPIVVFSKSYCPYSKRLKELLNTSYDITPRPVIVELDKHKDGAKLQSYIGDLSGRRTVPNLFINGVSRGGSDEMAKLHSNNELLDSLLEWAGPTVKIEKVNAPSNS